MAKSPATFVREATGLTKQISGIEALGMALSGMGLLYVFNASVFTPAFYPDANPLVGPLIGLLLILPVAGMYALFSIAMPRTGGDYVWTSRVLNSGTGFVINFSLTLLALSVIGVGSSVALPVVLRARCSTTLGVLQNNQSYLNLATTLSGTTRPSGSPPWPWSGTGIIVAASTRLVRCNREVLDRAGDNHRDNLHRDSALRGQLDVHNELQRPVPIGERNLCVQRGRRCRTEPVSGPTTESHLSSRRRHWLQARSGSSATSGSTTLHTSRVR